MASGAATTEGDLRLAALPFDRRRNGMIMGMGAAALVVESEDAVRERGMRAICEVLATQYRQQRLPRHPPERQPRQPGDGTADPDG